MLDFVGPQPRHFGAPRASARPLRAGDSAAASTRGASCNCEVITLTPHCNGTHTECVGHLTRERARRQGVIPRRLLLAVLLTSSRSSPATARESSDPAPRADDLLITRGALERAWPAPPAPRLQARARDPHAAQRAPTSRTRDYAPRRRRTCRARRRSWLVERGIVHLVSMCPRSTAAAMGAGSPRTASSSACRRGAARSLEAAAARSTITELAFVPDALADGWYLLSLQVPALGGDAVPCRPLLYPLRTHEPRAAPADGRRALEASDWARAQDAADPLRALRARFALPRAARRRAARCTSAGTRSAWRRSRRAR